MRGSDRSGRRARTRGRFELLEAKRVLDSNLTLAITEIMYNPIDPTAAELAVDSMFDNDDFEFIELQNTTDGALMIDLNGVTLMTPSFTFQFTGSAVTALEPGAYVLLVRDQVAFETRYGTALNGIIAGTYSGDFDNGGDTITVTDSVAEIIHDFEYNDKGSWPGRADGKGSSLEVKDLLGDYNDSDTWRNSGEFNGTPGATGLGPVNAVVVNEVLSHTDLPLVDTIELHNMTGQPIDVGGWYLSDTDGDYQKFRIPDGTMIDAGGYLTFDDDDFNSSMGVDPNDFSLNADEGEDVWLLAGDASGNLTHFVDHVTFGAQLNGESWGRWPNGTGDLYPMTLRTLGAANSGPRVGPVVVTEIMYNPPDPGIMGVDPADLEFVEIHNPTASAVDLTEWRLRGEVDFDFPNGFSLGAGATLIVVRFDPNSTSQFDTFRTVYGLDPSAIVLGPWFDDAKLSDGGATVRLQRPDEEPMDRPGFIPRLLEDEVKYNDKDPWPELADGDGGSLTRLATNLWGNDPTSWTAAQATPGSAAVGAPVLNVTVDALLTNDSTPPVTGTITDPAATVSVTINGSEYAATNNGDGTWTLADDTIATPLVDGVYDVQVTGTNAGGPRTDDTTDELTIDTTAPVVTVDVLAIDDITPELTGTVDDALATIDVMIAGMTYAATNNGDGTWILPDDTITTPLETGFHNVDVTARDEAGNSMVALTKLHVDADMTSRPWRNPANFMDVDDDMQANLTDAQAIFDDLNANGIRPLAPEQGGAAPFWDVTGDGLASWLDALIVINHRNRIASLPTNGEVPASAVGGSLRVQSAEAYPKSPLKTFPLTLEAALLSDSSLHAVSDDAVDAVARDISLLASTSPAFPPLAGTVPGATARAAALTLYGHRRVDDSTSTDNAHDVALADMAVLARRP